jgi:hypothetical protein
MKTTYLIYKDPTATNKELKVATQQEWDAILKANRGLPMDQRRCFIKDCFEDSGELDCLYIETGLQEYRKWHSKHECRERKRKEGAKTLILSLNLATSSFSDDGTLLDIIPDTYNLEDTVMSELMLKKLEQELIRWKPWAGEMLRFYLEGGQLNCNRCFMDRYDVSDKTVQRWKKTFEQFVRNFYEKNVGF